MHKTTQQASQDDPARGPPNAMHRVWSLYILCPLLPQADCSGRHALQCPSPRGREAVAGDVGHVQDRQPLGQASGVRRLHAMTRTTGPCSASWQAGVIPPAGAPQLSLDARTGSPPSLLGPGRPGHRHIIFMGPATPGSGRWADGDNITRQDGSDASCPLAGLGGCRVARAEPTRRPVRLRGCLPSRQAGIRMPFGANAGPMGIMS